MPVSNSPSPGIDSTRPVAEPSRRVRPQLLKGLLLVGGSMVALVLVELMLLLAMSEPGPYHWDRRISLYRGSGGVVFENLASGGFRYARDAVIELETYYALPDWRSWALEFAYRFRTNNFGLVQEADLEHGRPTLLVLGDSYTEGLGAPPWINDIASELDRATGLQVANGGILGTGLLHFADLLHALTAEGVAVRRVVVVFISDDWVRPRWRFPDPVLNCIADVSACERVSGYYGLPAEGDKPQFLDDAVRRQRPARHILNRLALYRKGYRPLRDRIGAARRDPLFAENTAAALRIVEAVGVGNVLFIHLPAKDEVLRGAINPYGVRARQFLADRGIPLRGGIDACGLAPHDFYQTDGHPNPGGYQRIAACVLRFVTEHPPFRS